MHASGSVHGVPNTENRIKEENLKFFNVPEIGEQALLSEHQDYIVSIHWGLYRAVYSIFVDSVRAEKSCLPKTRYNSSFSFFGFNQRR